MTKATWQAHMATVGFETTNVKALGPERSREALAHMRGCSTCAARKATTRANRRRRERDDALRSCGLVKTPYGWE